MTLEKRITRDYIYDACILKDFIMRNNVSA